MTGIVISAIVLAILCWWLLASWLRCRRDHENVADWLREQDEDGKFD